MHNNALYFLCLALTVWQHVAGGWWFDGYRYWYWLLVSVWPNNIGYWVLSSFFGIVLTLKLIITQHIGCMGGTRILKLGGNVGQKPGHRGAINVNVVQLLCVSKSRNGVQE